MTAKTFVDPRTNPDPFSSRPPARPTTDPEKLSELHRLCREHRLYDVERWIQEGEPLQLTPETTVRGRRPASALEIALEDGNHALVLLLLCNGYDPNLERYCPLDIALESRRWDLVDLLLEWGADPNDVELRTLFGTYQSKLFYRFRELGVDLTKGHGLARALAYHTSNKPLFGFARRLRKEDPKIQRELNAALASHAGKGNEKGVALCLWAGADPHAPAPSLRYGWGDEDDEEDADEGDERERFRGFSAIWMACSRGQTGVLEKLGPDPSRDDFDELYRTADDRAVVRFLANLALPKDPGIVIGQHIRRLSLQIAFHQSEWLSLWTLESLFEVGLRWENSSKQSIAGVRDTIRRLPDRTFVDLMKLLAKNDHCSPEILTELARTPAMRRRMKEVGFIPPSPDDSDPPRRNRPTRSRQVLSKCGIELPKPRPYIPRVVRIGARRAEAREIRFDRAELFERVWSEPVSKLAERWGLSGPGLAKQLRRIEMPLPPRGYWAKVRAGKRVKRPPLPELEAGEAEEIVVWEEEG